MKNSPEYTLQDVELLLLLRGFGMDSRRIGDMGQHPAELVEWKVRGAEVLNPDGLDESEREIISGPPRFF